MNSSGYCKPAPIRFEFVDCGSDGGEQAAAVSQKRHGINPKWPSDCTPVPAGLTID
jgi:hypothetical protein